MEAKASNKSGTPKYIYTIQSFQNGWIAESEIFCCKRKFICASSTERMPIVKKKLEKIRYVLLVRKFTRISVPMFWLGSCPQIFTKLLKIPIAILRRIDLRMIIYLDDVSNGSLHSGDKNMSQDINIFITPYGFCHQKEEV